MYKLLSPIQIIYDGASLEKPKDSRVLENYFNDLYHLFLHKLSGVVHQSSLKEEESIKLKALLEELIKVRMLLEKD
jgi:hypothetical protein